ncbi:FYVE zinc finger domain-containing protein [Novipirellula artificiosorum]|uniref:Uncharacterized protein n=1 Tax=Novipirellula artificiosorum TaxID=2528016 RepID=A0A5C6D6R7_9BACT|nr:hypothetical protein [Novipirellula artificiosorum]TWU31397.1 hypothetical protein Poly41_62660 [Novipirellula artificiosorum]
MCHVPFDSFRSRVHHARQCGDLYFASLITKETIESAYGKATSILRSARVYKTSVTLWVFLSQVMSIHRGCLSAVVMDMAMGRYKGKLTHEVSLFRQIDEIIHSIQLDRPPRPEWMSQQRAPS